MRFLKCAVAAALVSCACAAQAAHVAFMYQNGPNVEVTGSGPLNTDALGVPGLNGPAPPQMTPASGVFVYGVTSYSTFIGIGGPALFGPGGLAIGSSATGQRVGIAGNGKLLLVPQGYVSGAPLSGGAVWNGKTLAALGLTPGTYVWTWGTGPTADSLTLHISLALPASVTATNTVSGTFTPGSTVTYTVLLNNTGPGAQTDNAGAEFTDVLPAGVTLVNATATSGTAAATVGTNTVTWNGGIPAAGSVTLTITATVNPAAPGTVISNQGTVSYDSDGNGINNAANLTDDPSAGGAADPTSFAVAAAPAAPAAVPTLSEWALIALASIMGMFGRVRARRR